MGRPTLLPQVSISKVWSTHSISPSKPATPSRADAYHTAIKRGIRSIAQLQFKDEVDAYYISCRERVIGAIRTESDNNEIRIDNMQHALAALLKYRELNARSHSTLSAAESCKVA